MLGYILMRLTHLIPLLIVISIISFIVITLPPGDYLTSHITRLQSQGTSVAQEEIERLKRTYGLDQPAYQQYLRWVYRIVRHGDFGMSFQWERPVRRVIGERIALTMVISICTIVFTWVVAIPIGIYAATHQYSFLDYLFTFFGFIGLAIPNFLLALVLMYVAFAHFDLSVTGLFSPEYAAASWSFGKFIDMMQRIWLPVIVIGTGGTAGLIRVMRGCLLDELRKQYVITARTKGLAESRLLFKYPVRLAINPLISTIGWLLPAIVSGEAITGIVLNLPTTGPVMLQALMSQDMYLAGSFVLILSSLTVIGTLVSDILLAWVDPRIRYGGVSEK